jgi:hypothetical protein
MDDRAIFLGWLAAVGLPAAQALFTGFVIWALVYAICWAAGLPRPGVIGLCFGLLAILIMWLIAINSWHSAAYYQPQVYVSQPEIVEAEQYDMLPEPTPIRVRITDADGMGETWSSLPCTEPQMRALCAGLAAGVPFAYANWCGAGKPFSRTEFEGVRDEMLQRNLIRWVNPTSRQAGVELSPGGRALVRTFAASTTPPRLDG